MAGRTEPPGRASLNLMLGLETGDDRCGICTAYKDKAAIF